MNQSQSALQTGIPPAPHRSTMWGVAIVGMWLLGIQLWLILDRSLVRTTTDLIVYSSAIAICFIPRLRTWLGGLGSLLDRRGVVATPVLFVCMSMLAMAVLYVTALQSHRKFSPVFHDEFSYLLQTTMLAHGHLSMPAHPLSAFFDTFYVITDRAYASQYFPGAALMFMPGVWFGLDGWVMPLIVTGAATGMMFLVIRELFDGLAGLAAVAVLLSVQWTRFLAIVPVAQEPTLLLGLFAVFAALRWISTRRLGWITCCGTSIGWMAITRPVDAAVYALVLAVMILATQFRSAGNPVTKLRWRRLLTAGLLPLLPFLALQMAINQRVTGNLLQTPFAYYADRDLPNTSLGFHSYDANPRPASTLAQKQAAYVDGVLPMIANHTPSKVIARWFPWRAKIMVAELFGDVLLFILVPAALITMRDRRRWVIVSILPLWCVVYSFYTFDYAHYYVVLLPCVLVLIFAGFDSISWLFVKAGRLVMCLRFTVPVAISVMAMPQVRIDLNEQFIDTPIEPAVREFQASVPDARSILLVKWDSTSSVQWESVYNVHNSWPDDAKMIRAHDLGDERNLELFRYYARTQPDRVVYRFDRGSGTFVRLGKVTELVETSGTKRDSIPPT